MQLLQIADKFQAELTGLMNVQAEEDKKDLLLRRIEAASKYFMDCLDKSFLQPVQHYRRSLKVKQKTRKYVKALSDLENFIVARMNEVSKVKDQLFDQPDLIEPVAHG